LINLKRFDATFGIGEAVAPVFTPLATRLNPTPTLNGCDLTLSTGTQSSEQENSYLTASKRHPSTPYSHNTPNIFTRNPAIYFPEVDNACVYAFGMLPGFLENLVKSGNLFCSATATMKTALGITHLWFNYFAASSHALFLGG